MCTKLPVVVQAIERPLVAPRLTAPVAQRAPLLPRLHAAAPVSLTLALSWQAHGDVDAAHEGEAADAQQRRLRIGVSRRAIDVLEAAHDRGSMNLDGQPGRDDDLH